jgi:VIT1/CCC1 family predicted Fe2+/Mn2+ transporter
MSRRATRWHHRELHKSERSGWLRAAVLGSDDAIVSTSSLMLGVAASSASNTSILMAGIAGLAAGAMSMAVGEYVSVSSQHDAERADIELERSELATQPEAELRELAAIYVKRGLDKDLAMTVAKQLTAHDPLSSHLRDELGIEKESLANPWQAAVASAASFALFALVPILALLIAPPGLRAPSIAVLSLASLGVLGGLGARLGGAPVLRGVLRVAIGGAFAMVVTAAIGSLFGVAAS